MVVIYPDDLEYNNQLMTLCNYDYIMINHDNDLKDDDSGEYKKLHTHLIIRFKNARTISALAKECFLKENMIEPVKNLNSSLKYLIHFKNDEKYQYSIDNVISNCNLFDRLKKLTFEDKTEDEKAYSLFEFISTFEGFLNFNDFFAYVCKTGQYSVYRRDSFTFCKLIDLHNKKFVDYENI